ncbi:MAG: hypothetical protein JW795_20835 [Chitinivibrionales bacterium]|nr:hypothetical protein [Chitinivibrionales bacterium]
MNVVLSVRLLQHEVFLYGTHGAEGILFLSMLIGFCLFGCHKQPPSEPWTTLDTANSSLKTNVIRQVLVENNTITWIGTFDDGLYRRSGSTWVKVQTPDVGKCIFSIIKDEIGGIWFGTANNGAFYYYQDQWHHFWTDQGLCDGNVWDIFIDHGNTAWLCSRYKGLSTIHRDSVTCYNATAAGESLHDRQITTVKQDLKGRMWIGTARSGLSAFFADTTLHFTSRNGLSGNYIRACICDTSIQWVGSWDGGLDHYTNSGWDHIEEVSKPVVVLHYDSPSATLWVGTWGKGAYSLHGGTWRHISTKTSGIADDYIIDIDVFDNGTIAFATNKGIALYTP